MDSRSTLATMTRSAHGAGRGLSSGALFVAACVCAAGTLILLYWWRLDQVPPYFVHDEAGFGLASFLLATTGRDYFGNLLPVYVEYFDNHQLGGAIHVYWAIPFVRVLGLSVASVRLSVAIVGLLSLAGFGVLAWRLTGSRWIALLGVWILGASPLFFIQSRLFHDGLMPVPFIIAWLICVVEFEKRRDGRFLLLSAAILGAGFYSYGTARMIMPAYLGLTLLLALLSRACSWRTVAAAGVLFGLMMVPGLLFAARDPELYMARFRGLSWLTDDISPQSAAALYLHHYLASFDPVDLFLQGDGSFIHSTGRAGVYLWATVPLAAVGVLWFGWRAVTSRSPLQLLVPLAFLLFPVPLALIAELHSPARAVYAVPIYAALCVAGLRSISAIRAHSRLSSVVLGLVLLAVTVEAGVFFADYFGPYPARAAGQAEINGNKPEAFRVLMEDASSREVYYDVENVATTTFARFFQVQYGFEGAVLPAPPEWADRLPIGARVLTTRPEAYGSGFERLATISELAPGRPEHVVIRRARFP